MTVHKKNQIKCTKLSEQQHYILIELSDTYTVYSSDKQWSGISMDGLEDERQKTAGGGGAGRGRGGERFTV